METEEFLSELKNGRKDFSHENLAMVELNGASLVGVNLRGANLRGACMEEACLEAAKLEGGGDEGIGMSAAPERKG